MNSFIYAVRGIGVSLAEQRNLRIHLGATFVVIGLAIFYGVGALEWCMLIFSIASVITAELINSSLEGLIDLVSPQQNPLAGKVKDIAAGAVLISAMGAAGVGIIIFWPYIF